VSIATKTGDDARTAVAPAQISNAWWFRKEFEVTSEQAGGSARSIFGGINCRANIWLNGVRIVTADETFREFHVFNPEVTGCLKPGMNAVVVEVLPHQPGDFADGFVDWNPRPPDRNMGLFCPVDWTFTKTLPSDKTVIKNGKHQPRACERQSPFVHHASPGLSSHFRNQPFAVKSRYEFHSSQRENNKIKPSTCTIA
jgi:glycosyl hydrolase family 2